MGNTDQLIALLNHLRKSGWAKRQGIKFAAFVTAMVAGWLSTHGGGEHTAAIAAAIGAVALALWEAFWSWAAFKAGNEKIVAALQTEPPRTMNAARQEVRSLAHTPEK